MDFRLLGATGVKVSALCFGTMNFGGVDDETTSAALFHRCREAGINFFDCADVYSDGRSEELLGRLVASERDALVIASKATQPTSDDRNARGGSRRHLLRAAEASLRRLGTDRIDVYYLHRFDRDARLEETLRALDDLVSAGKILYPAASNHAAWQVQKALGLCDRFGWAPYAAVQPMYNLFKRTAEIEVLPQAAEAGLAVVPYSPLGGGYLTGKYGRNRKPETGRILTNPDYQVRYGDAWMLDAADRFTAFARERGWHPASLAVAWVAGHPAVTAPIIGARTVSQLDDSLRSVEVPMTPALWAEVSALTPAPPPANDRNDDLVLGPRGEIPSATAPTRRGGPAS
jgi:aryl-alcohol dehydrogenase-like predicted oxidoreductase